MLVWHSEVVKMVKKSCDMAGNKMVKFDWKGLNDNYIKWNIDPSFCSIITVTAPPHAKSL